MSKKIVSRVRSKERKNILTGMVHIKSTFNNTIITITDSQGNTISYSSAGACGFKGSRKSTPYAAQMAAESAGRKAQEHGIRQVDVYLNGPGSGREAALKNLQALGIKINSLKDITSIPHNGCRAPNRRRI